MKYITVSPTFILPAAIRFCTLDFWKLLNNETTQYPFTILGNPFHLNDEVCHKARKTTVAKNISFHWMECVELMTGSASPAVDITLEKSNVLIVPVSAALS